MYYFVEIIQLSYLYNASLLPSGIWFFLSSRCNRCCFVNIFNWYKVAFNRLNNPEAGFKCIQLFNNTCRIEWMAGIISLAGRHFKTDNRHIRINDSSMIPVEHALTEIETSIIHHINHVARYNQWFERELVFFPYIFVFELHVYQVVSKKEMALFSFPYHLKTVKLQE